MTGDFDREGRIDGCAAIDLHAQKAVRPNVVKTVVNEPR
jgi:hypothetical protein